MAMFMLYEKPLHPHPSPLFSTPKTHEKKRRGLPRFMLRTAEMHQNSQEVAETIKAIEPGSVEQKQGKGSSKLLLGRMR